MIESLIYIYFKGLIVISKNRYKYFPFLLEDKSKYIFISLTFRL